jgi:hypothetical protein
MLLGYFQRSTGLSSKSKKWLTALPLLACIGLFLVHFFVIWKYAVDIPYWDEWVTFSPKYLPKGLTFHWLFAQQNEHRPATTKLLVWSLFQLNGWNLIVHQLLNFALYGFILIWIVWFAKKISKVPVWIILSFMIFLLSPINYENHSWGYQSLIHFWLLFFLASSYYLFTESQRWSDLIIACTLSILSIYSFGSGVVSTSTVLVIFCIFKCARAFSSKDRGKRTLEFLQLVAVIIVLGSALALWFVGYHKPPYHPALTFPYKLKFWNFFLNIVSFGFGIDRASRLLGVVCLLIVLVPIWGIWRQKSNLSGGQWATLAIAISILAVLGSASVTRAGFGVGVAKSSRYAEFGMILIPFSLLNWSFFLKDRERSRNQVIAGLWVFCFLTFANNWIGFGNYDAGAPSFRNYPALAARKMVGVECVRAYYFQGGNGNCPTIYPGVLAAELEEAKKLNVSFYRSMYHQYQQGRSQPQNLASSGVTTIGLYRSSESSFDLLRTNSAGELTMPLRIRGDIPIRWRLGWKWHWNDSSIPVH